MKHPSLIAALAACMFSLSFATVAHALEKSDPPKEEWGGAGLGVGPGDPSLGGTTMPPGGDERKQKEAERKDKEAERKRKEAEQRAKQAEKPVVKSIGKVPTPRHTSTEVFETARSSSATKRMVSDSTTANRDTSAPSSGTGSVQSAAAVKAASPLTGSGRPMTAPVAGSSTPAAPSSFAR